MNHPLDGEKGREFLPLVQILSFGFEEFSSDREESHSSRVMLKERSSWHFQDHQEGY